MATISDLPRDVLYVILNGSSPTTGKPYVPRGLRFVTAAVSPAWRDIVRRPTLKDAERLTGSIANTRHAQAVAQGRGVLASDVAMMVASLGTPTAHAMVRRACDCPWIELAAATAASNVPDAAAWALGAVNDHSRDDQFRCRHRHSDGRQHGRCFLLASAARADAPETIRLMASDGCQHDCLLHAAREAARRGNVNVLRAIININRCRHFELSRTLWDAVGEHGHANVANLLVETETEIDGTYPFGGWRTGRLVSHWQEIAAVNGTAGAITLSKRFGFRLDVINLAYTSLCHSQTTFCETLINSSPDLVHTIPGLLFRRMASRGSDRLGPGALHWLVFQPWFDPTPDEVEEIVALPYKWRRDDLQTLAARWPDRDLVLHDGAVLRHRTL
ncbi:Ankyrin repeat domain containing protein [Pandoravirus salinus]|uniref:Ankyrin repeat domain containing protein n=1 Tax=Pandoravirus salinus TaxID=1349410 RepID=S4W4N0_9VIRU|nr:ankyrin repeat domain [Pandoravirus salinus]AGO85677.2 Ankyrin repeat domain containing protein [Pandoravirus salinus]